jgi:hypothetical protein
MAKADANDADYQARMRLSSLTHALLIQKEKLNALTASLFDERRDLAEACIYLRHCIASEKSTMLSDMTVFPLLDVAEIEEKYVPAYVKLAEIGCGDAPYDAKRHEAAVKTQHELHVFETEKHKHNLEQHQLEGALYKNAVERFKLEQALRLSKEARTLSPSFCALPEYDADEPSDLVAFQMQLEADDFKSDLRQEREAKRQLAVAKSLILRFGSV